jgi:hypothetical protein
MAQKPSFITGATAKIKAGAITLAYAQDVSYNVTVTTIPIETMGRYEVVSNEPVAYFVDGTMSIIRYTSAAQGLPGVDSASTGNSTDKWKTSTDQSAGAHFRPGDLITSKTFDIEIFQKTEKTGAAATNISVAKLYDCRLTRKGGSINKRGILVEQFAFNAIYHTDDAAAVSGSGDTDLSA